MSPDEEFSIRINFPQYAAIMETEETEQTVTMITRCPLCQKEVVRQVVEKWPADASPDQIVKLTYKLYAGKDWAKGKYWEHLTTQHPEHFGEGNVAS